MAELFNAKTRVPEALPASDIEQAVLSGTHAYRKDDRINVVGPDGNAVSVTGADLKDALGQGYKIERPEARSVRKYLEENQGLKGDIKVGLAQAADEFAGGLPEIAADYLQPSLERQKREAIKEEHEIANTLGGLVGFGGGLLTGVGIPGITAKASVKGGEVAAKLAEKLLTKRVEANLASRGVEKAAEVAPSLVKEMAIGATKLGTEGVIQMSPQAAVEALMGDQDAAKESLLLYGLGGGAILGAAGGPLKRVFGASTSEAGAFKKALNVGFGTPEEFTEAALQKASPEDIVLLKQAGIDVTDTTSRLRAIEAAKTYEEASKQISDFATQLRKDRQKVYDIVDETLSPEIGERAVASEKLVSDLESLKKQFMISGKSGSAVRSGAEGAINRIDEATNKLKATGDLSEAALLQERRGVSSMIRDRYLLGYGEAEEKALNDIERLYNTTLKTNNKSYSKVMEAVAPYEVLFSNLKDTFKLEPFKNEAGELAFRPTSGTERIVKYAGAPDGTFQVQAGAKNALQDYTTAQNKLLTNLEKNLTTATGDNAALLQRLNDAINPGGLKNLARSLENTYYKEVMLGGRAEGSRKTNLFAFLTGGLGGIIGSAVAGALGGGIGAAAGGALGGALGATSDKYGRRISAALIDAYSAHSRVREKIGKIPSILKTQNASLTSTSVLPPIRRLLGSKVEGKSDTEQIDLLQEKLAPHQLIPQKSSENVIMVMNQMGLKDLGMQLAQKQQEVIQYLGTIMPTKTNVSTEMMPKSLKSKITYPPLQVAQFKQKLAGIIEPLSIVDDLKNNALSYWKVQSVKQVYPVLFGQMRQRVLEYVANAKEPIDWVHKMQLSMFFDAPLDPTLSISIVSGLQKSFAMAKPQGGQETGGSQVPLGAKFNSINSFKTPAEELIAD